MIRVLKLSFNRCKRQSKGKHDLGHRISNTSVKIWNVTHCKSLEIVVKECEKLLWDSMLHASFVRKSLERQEAVTQVLSEITLFEIDFIEYK